MADPPVPTLETAEEQLWTAADLARYLGYAESTVTRMANAEPDKLPPRVARLFKPRWVPQVCRDWVRAQGVTVGGRRKRGRPRKRVEADETVIWPRRVG